MVTVNGSILQPVPREPWSWRQPFAEPDLPSNFSQNLLSIVVCVMPFGKNLITGQLEHQKTLVVSVDLRHSSTNSNPNHAVEVKMAAIGWQISCIFARFIAVHLLAG